ncbi:MAG: hypothetical protein QOF20_1383 [Acidimicrobiaceae bacterium]|nr:hypothetical protein [Acidimicrobiaceae bacterium]MDQ1376840.1 hypothetical protein [Acidimicrobiaceae bacterium]MDQ1416857.1 hypothetical protein [Acidimicrobiaceae bacterium]
MKSVATWPMSLRGDGATLTPRGRGRGVDIRICVTVRQPPSGEVSTDGGEAHPFAGWLQLLKILSDILKPEGTAG